MDPTQSSGEPPAAPRGSDPLSVSTPHLAHHHPPVWLQRIYLVIYVLFCLSMGSVLVVLPWTPDWSHNAFLAAYPGARQLLTSNFTRGLVSGIGLVDMWLGFWEALLYHED